MIYAHPEGEQLVQAWLAQCQARWDMLVSPLSPTIRPRWVDKPRACKLAWAYFLWSQTRRPTWETMQQSISSTRVVERISLWHVLANWVALCFTALSESFGHGTEA